MPLDLNLIIESLTTVTFVAMKVSDRIGAQMNYSLRIMHSSDCLSLIYSENRRNMLGRTGGPLHSDQTMQFSWKRTTMLFSFVKEQTEENVNMLFVTNATRNIQKARRDQEVVFSVKMSWCRLVIMSYAIYSYVLMCGGVPEITWVDPSGQNVP